MAFHLSGLFSGNTSAAKDAGTKETYTDSAEKARAQAVVRSLVPGQTVSGELVGRNGNEVQIRIGQDTVLTARLDQALKLVQGQMMSFEVKSNAGGVLALRPLFENMAQDLSASRALTEAGLPVEEKSMQMASCMMKEGMNVGREALQHMYRQVVSFPQASVENLVQMERLGIPVTEENIAQFEAYKNYEHKLSDGIKQMLGELPQALSDAFLQGGGKGGLSFIYQLLDSFLSLGKEEGMAGSLTGAENSLPANGEASVLLQTEGKEAGQAGNMPGGATDIREQIFTGVNQGRMPENASIETGLSGGETADALENAKIKQPVFMETGASGAETLTGEERKELISLFGKAGADTEQLALLRQGNMQSQDILELAKSLAQKLSESYPEGHGQSKETMEALGKLFSTGGFQKALQQQVTGQWMLTPEEVGQKKEVSEFYVRLREQTGQLLRALADAGRTDSSLYKTASNMRENVDFIQQLNQVYAYVQLPLKLKGNNAHGELYVYTNKKNMAKKDGNISALLHLDMEHLGTVDVYVVMSDGKIGTNFYLENEEMMDFLEPHLPELTERLNNRGYETEVKVTVREEKVNVMEEILETDKNIGVMSQFSFDVRA